MLRGTPDDTNERRIEAVSIIKRDYLVSLLLTSPFAFWAAYIIRRMGGGLAVGYLVIAAAATLAALAIGMTRIARILSVAETGERATAEVKQVIAGKNRGRIHFKYVYNGQAFEGVQAFRARGSLKKIPKGLRVTVAFDRRKPKSAIVPSIFSDQNPFFEEREPRRP